MPVIDQRIFEKMREEGMSKANRDASNGR